MPGKERRREEAEIAVNTGLEERRQRVSTAWQRDLQGLLLAEDKLLCQCAWLRRYT
jgi:hypothetical protein